MHKKACCILVLFLALSTILCGQKALFGKITKEGSEEVLRGVNIFNITELKHNVSDLGGNYRILAVPGDTLVFSSAGYLKDSLIVKDSMFSKNWPILLTPNVITLAEIKVDEMGAYRADSAQRRQDYSFILDKKHPVKFLNEKRPGDNPGFSFSPIGYYSSSELQKRKLKKRLIQEEMDFYVDFKFAPYRVSELTGLVGDSLKLFLKRYRPTYQFCRKANSQDLKLYINDKLKLFKEGS
jgi:CarboxypepD_reg-like domain